MIFSSLITASMVLSLFSSEDDSESLLSDFESQSKEALEAEVKALKDHESADGVSFQDTSISRRNQPFSPNSRIRGQLPKSTSLLHNPRQSTSSSSASDHLSSSSTVDSQLSSRQRSCTVTKTSQRIHTPRTHDGGYILQRDQSVGRRWGRDSENRTLFHKAADHNLVFVDLDLINNRQETEVESRGNDSDM
ncbi:uncharacterized protein PGTG_07873 [Puccinia graminis f. sp. tritici CRL 75-36-700-3]|uniref:Endonuclease/exonuclease/phosphatase domain-containing protein n=1 Tax=Puccinia graminis f. sp. tritici (strain CRL 75-36-700-3 / race SCCL) TaxID=418459 RepID=E3KBB1_PUCGT|nr:uncharacterized protein PGTG_07873 [Puccinia graminis f. sp. tritici CRL 75-36-700-3]EFP81624.2 hypothetical protein PGTG_07873 [Puccinia graminis f. sp. tritici CRL 75-36-700-3]